jgi:hypothetical protein
VKAFLSGHHGYGWWYTEWMSDFAEFQRRMRVAKEIGRMLTALSPPEAKAAFRKALSAALEVCPEASTRETIEGLLKDDPRTAG